MEGEFGDFKSLKDKSDRLSDELNSLRTKYNKLQIQYDELKNDYSQSKQAAESGESRYSQLVDSYQQLTSEHDKLDKALKKALVDVDTWQARVTDRDNQANSLEKEIRRVPIQLVSAIARELASCKLELANLEDNLKTLKTFHDP